MTYVFIDHQIPVGATVHGRPLDGRRPSTTGDNTTGISYAIEEAGLCPANGRVWTPSPTDILVFVLHCKGRRQFIENWFAPTAASN